MTSRDALLALADRVEQATGPDRALDATIHEAATTFPPRRAGPGWPNENELVVPVFPGWAVLPSYTASLDHALVPEGWFTKLALEDRHSHSWSWTLRGGFGHEAHGRAATPALALCAAALRARANMEN